MARSTFRSVTYDLDASVALARTVARSSGGISSDQLALSLGYSGAKNGAFLTRLANARLFGLVAGSSSRVVLADRGAQVLSASTAVSGQARVEAFFTVPLFRVVAEEYGEAPIPTLEELTLALRERFGEGQAKARTSAIKLLDSARQARMIVRSADGNERFSRNNATFTGFMDVAGLPPIEGLHTESARQVGGDARTGTSSVYGSPAGVSAGAGEGGQMDPSGCKHSGPLLT